MSRLKYGITTRYSFLDKNIAFAVLLRPCLTFNILSMNEETIRLRAKKGPAPLQTYPILKKRTCNGLAVFWPTMDLAEI